MCVCACEEREKEWGERKRVSKRNYPLFYEDSNTCNCLFVEQTCRLIYTFKWGKNQTLSKKTNVYGMFVKLRSLQN